MGCQSDWPDLVRYPRKINVRVKFHNDLAVICTNGIILNCSQKLQKTLYNLCVKDEIKLAESILIQGRFFRLTDKNIIANDFCTFFSTVGSSLKTGYSMLQPAAWIHYNNEKL